MVGSAVSSNRFESKIHILLETRLARPQDRPTIRYVPLRAEFVPEELGHNCTNANDDLHRRIGVIHARRLRFQRHVVELDEPETDVLLS